MDHVHVRCLDTAKHSTASNGVYMCIYSVCTYYVCSGCVSSFLMKVLVYLFKKLSPVTYECSRGFDYKDQGEKYNENILKPFIKFCLSLSRCILLKLDV